MIHEFSTRRRVEFADTDCAGIIHFTNYYRYMEEAEHAFLRSLGLSVRWPAEGGEIGFPRLSASCEFLRPARFEDVLDIRLEVRRKGRTSITYAFAFSKDGEEVARGEVTAVACQVGQDGKIRPVPLPGAFAEKIGEAPGAAGGPGGSRPRPAGEC
jgi:acyl-CoA thioester hydrolase